MKVFGVLVGEDFVPIRWFGSANERRRFIARHDEIEATFEIDGKPALIEFLNALELTSLPPQ